MIVLSLFGGMECGRIALDKMGIVPDKYYSSEIDKHAIAEVSINYPDVVHLGDINNWINWEIPWHDIDLVIGGSPCQGFSLAGKGLAFDDPRSKLFFIYVDILNHIKTMKKIVYGTEPWFMLENVKMKSEYLKVIDDFLGVSGVFINSSLVSAQNRQRYYWCNWEVNEPADTGVVLSDVLEDGYVDRDKAYCIDACYGKGGNLTQYFDKSRRQLVFTTKDSFDDYRKLTIKECCRLQGVPDDYFKVSSNTQAYKMLGNGWQVDTIVHILNQLGELRA